MSRQIHSPPMASRVEAAWRRYRELHTVFTTSSESTSPEWLKPLPGRDVNTARPPWVPPQTKRIRAGGGDEA